MEADIALDATWRDGGHVWDLFHRTCASSPKENYLGDRGWGRGEGIAPVWVYN